MSMKEIKVGERVTLEVIEQNVSNGCDGCFFGHDDTCYNPTYNGWADGFDCAPENRSDGKSVIFKQVKQNMLREDLRGICHRPCIYNDEGKCDMWDELSVPDETEKCDNQQKF